MSLEQSLNTLVDFANRFIDQANEDEKAALEFCSKFVQGLSSHNAGLAELKRRIDEHTLYLRSGWATEKPVAPDNTYDLLREISRAIGDDQSSSDAS